MPKKPKENLEVGYFRSRHLSICSLFHLDRHDAALLFAHYELIDEAYTEKVNIEKFAKKFLPDGKYAFQLLWSYFVLIFKDSRLGLGSLEYINNISMARMKVEDKNYMEDKENATYVELTAFLFMIVSINEKHFTHFLFWLVFEVNEEAKTRRGLVGIVSKLWKLDKSYIDKNKHKERVMYMALVKAAVKHLEASALDMKTFQIYDFRVQTAFSTPLKRLQAEVLKKIANKKFWMKGKEQIRLVLNDPSIVVPRMGERNSAGKVTHRSTGDRKYAWFEIRDFIEAFFRFHDTANGIIIEPVTLWQKLKKKLFPPKVKASTIVPVNLESSDAVTAFSLVEKVDSRKQWSINRYYDEADNNRDSALQMLEITQEELDEPLPELFTAEKNGDAVGGVRMKRSNQEGSDDDDDSSYGNDGDSQYSD
jgi:hypothetical protein